MPAFWMVRAGEGGYLADAFKDAKHVALGFDSFGDFTSIKSLDEMRSRIRTAASDLKPGAIANAAGVAWKFRHVMQSGDRVITYNPKSRQYALGTIVGDYRFEPGIVPDYKHVRAVRWDAEISRDNLSATSRNSLGSTLTLFEPGDEVLEEIESGGVSSDASESGSTDDSVEDEGERIRRDTLSRAHEFIKDRLLSLSPDEMEHLTAAVLRGMGYKARVTPKGPDRGRDVIASPDGLGFSSPRIVAEVKHRRKEAMGAPQIRAFVGGLRVGDNGLYVSTGGFTLEAKYEAVRASVQITLLDLDDLASLVVEHYDNFDADGRALLPLMRIYWPAS